MTVWRGMPAPSASGMPAICATLPQDASAGRLPWSAKGKRQRRVLGHPGARNRTGQPELFEHGFQTENGDIRCHVAPGTRSIFVFRTALLLGLDLSRYSVGWATQPGVNFLTARGYKVPIEEIPDLRIIRSQVTPWWETFDESQMPQVEGKLAQAVAARLLRAGRFPLWCTDASDCGRLDSQKSGIDILLWHRY